MKFSLLKNDTSTYWDEVCLGLIVLICVGGGIVLYMCKPEFLFIDAINSMVFGVLMILTGAMFVPGLIYRLLHNDTKKVEK